MRATASQNQRSKTTTINSSTYYPQLFHLRSKRKPPPPPLLTSSTYSSISPVSSRILMSNADLLCFSKPFSRDTSVEPTQLISSCLREHEQSPTMPETDTVSVQTPTGRTSWQLSRWSRVRSIRSHRRHGFPALGEKTGLNDPSLVSSLSPSCSSTSSVGEVKASSAGDVKEQRMEKMNGPVGFTDVMNQGKQIYMVSDGTGWTAEHSVYATLVQLQHCHGDKGRPVNTHLFSGVEDMERLLEIIRRAARNGALLLYTLADPTMAEATKHACQQLGVRSADILRPTSEVIAEHLGMAPSATPRVDPASTKRLVNDYTRLIHEAVEFTLMHDDGAQTEDLSEAHIVLLGVSRTGKTPLSIYLAQKGYKVANIPIVTGMELPKSLIEINQERIFGLTVSPTVLQQVRMERAKELGFLGSNYSEMDNVRGELERAHKLFLQNPSWPVIDVTGKAMEETAAQIVRMYNDKKQKRLMPLISKRY